MHGLYNLGIHLYHAALHVAAGFHGKARLWIDGRKDWQKKLMSWRSQHPGEVWWFHCASLGEFEQGRPVIEALKASKPHVKIVLTFFSPSGYEIRKSYAGADYIAYLPADTQANARQWLEILKPAQVVFVKYEYWANYFFEMRSRRIPLYVISAILRSDQRFFGIMKSFWSEVLRCVDHFFVQNQSTADLLSSVGIQQLTIAGDTRFDRVAAIAKQARALPEIAEFKGDHKCVVSGSSWPQDEAMLSEYIRLHPDVKWICVPHEIDEAHLLNIEKLGLKSVRYTRSDARSRAEAQVLIVDTIGMLSSIYQYADVVLIGGGFGKGIHNTLEAAVWYKPISFGPKYQKFDEANALIARGGAKSFANASELQTILSEWMQNENARSQSGKSAGAYVAESIGATRIILNHWL